MLAALALAVSSLAGTSAAYAQLSIEVTGAGANRIPVTIADFGGDPGMSRAVTSVIRSDLERSGLFKLVEQAQPGLTEASSIDFNAARSRGADAIAAGSVANSPRPLAMFTVSAS
jgi:TolB protein